MTNDTPIDEYIFWKHFIEDKQKTEDSIPQILYEVLDNAEAEMLFYLIDKRRLSSTTEVSKYLIN
ncbi:MAG: hypothetical protein QM479_16425 [Pseudomonadota bacterium]